MMAWLPTLLNERFGLDAKQLSVACLPYIALGVGKWVGGKSEYIAAEWFGVTGQLKQRKAIGVSGCETMEGFGKDMQKLGDSIERSASGDDDDETNE